MLQLNRLFQLATALSLLGWIPLFLLPNWPHTVLLAGTVATGLLSVLYVYLLLIARPEGIESPRGSFFSLRGIIRLFTNPRAVLVGWAHFLAFDLMVAVWIRTDAASQGIGHGWLVPIYFLTLMFGPAGLLMYFALRVLLAG